MHTSRAFTLLEMIVIMSIMGIVLVSTVPFYLNSQNKASADSAITHASLIDLAKISFLTKEIDAQSLWKDAADDEVRYILIRSYLPFPPEKLGDGSSGSKGYTPQGFRYVLNEISQPTTVIRLSDSKIIAHDLSEFGSSSKTTNGP